jgi:hypothetical protein
MPTAQYVKDCQQVKTPAAKEAMRRVAYFDQKSCAGRGRRAVCADERP